MNRQDAKGSEENTLRAARLGTPSSQGKSLGVCGGLSSEDPHP